jgi:hypothetical protein
MYDLQNLDISEYERAIASKLIALSVSKNYNEAKKEWIYNGEVNEHSAMLPGRCQLCGHGIRYGFIIHNKLNNMTLEVGSECIGNYAATSINYMKIKTDKVKIQKQNFKKNKAEIDNAIVYPILNATRKALETTNDPITKDEYYTLKNMQYWRKAQKFGKAMSSLMLTLNEKYNVVNAETMTKYGVVLNDEIIKYRDMMKEVEEIERMEAEKERLRK